MGSSFFLRITGILLVISMYVNYMLYDCDVGEIAGGAQR
jgi:hypothetical protein